MSEVFRRRLIRAEVARQQVSESLGHGTGSRRHVDTQLRARRIVAAMLRLNRRVPKLDS